MRLVATIVGLVLGGLVMTAASPTVNAQSETGQPAPQLKEVVVTVEKGDSLSKIAKKKATTYQRIFYANTAIADPDVIHPGQKLRIPSNEEKLKERPLPSSVPQAVPQQSTAPVTSQRKATVPAPRATSYVPPARTTSGGVWDRLAACESGGNWSINTGNGYYGGLQFSLSSWRGVGGAGYPHQASKAEQIRRGEMLKARGGWGHWPACSAKLGLR